MGQLLSIRDTLTTQEVFRVRGKFTSHVVPRFTVSYTLDSRNLTSMTRAQEYVSAITSRLKDKAERAQLSRSFATRINLPQV